MREVEQPLPGAVESSSDTLAFKLELEKTIAKHQSEGREAKAQVSMARLEVRDGGGDCVPLCLRADVRRAKLFKQLRSSRMRSAITHEFKLNWKSWVPNGPEFLVRKHLSIFTLLAPFFADRDVIHCRIDQGTAQEFARAGSQAREQ